MNELISFLNKWFEGKIKSLQLKKTVAGKVISVLDDMTEATVELPNTGLVKLLNKSGEELSEGDSVWVEYRTKPSSGVIAMRNGKAKPLGGDGGSKYIYVGNAVALTHKQAEEYYFADKLLEKVYVNNNNVIIYDFPGDHIIIDGKPAVLLGSSATGDTELERYKSIAKPSDVMTECSFALAGKSGKYFCRPSEFGYGSTSGAFYCRCQPYYTKKDGSTDSISAYVDIKSPPALMGIVVCIRTIYAPSTIYPYGYASGTLGIAVFDSAGALLGAKFVSSGDQSISYFPFASQAEYDAAVGIVARLDVQPSEANEAIAEVLEDSNNE